jgi:hypothetical protein
MSDAQNGLAIVLIVAVLVLGIAVIPTHATSSGVNNSTTHEVARIKSRVRP